MVKDVRPRDSGTYECQVMSMKIVLYDRSSLHNIVLHNSTRFLRFPVRPCHSCLESLQHVHCNSAMQCKAVMMIIICSGVRTKTLQSPPHSAPYCDRSVRDIIILFTSRQTRSLDTKIENVNLFRVDDRNSGWTGHLCGPPLHLAVDLQVQIRMVMREGWIQEGGR